MCKRCQEYNTRLADERKLMLQSMAMATLQANVKSTSNVDESGNHSGVLSFGKSVQVWFEYNGHLYVADVYPSNLLVVRTDTPTGDDEEVTPAG